MNHSSKFYSSLGLLIFLNGIVKPVWIFGIDRQVQNAVGTETYGIYFSLFNLCIVFSFLLDWGLTIFFNRQASSEQGPYINQIGSFLILKLIFAFLYIAVISLTGKLAGIKRWDILWSVMLIQILASFFIFIRSIFTAQQWCKTDAWLSVLDKALMILVCGSFLYHPFFAGSFSIEKFLRAQILCTLSALLISLLVLFSKGIKIHSIQLSFFNKQVLFTALPFALIVFLMSVHQRMDGFLLERLHSNGAYEAGIYAAGYRLLDAANMPGYLLASFLMPYIARQWNNSGSDVHKVILQSRHLLIMPGIAVITIGLVLAPWLQVLLYHHYNPYAADVLRWCLSSLVGYSLIQVYGTVMTATGHIRSFCYITFAIVILNLILNFLLIPFAGARGCGIGAFVSQLTGGIVLAWYVNKKLGIKIHFQSLLIYSFNGLLLLGIIFGGNELNVNHWILLAIAAIIVLLMMFASRLISPVNRVRAKNNNT